LKGNLVGAQKLEERVQKRDEKNATGAGPARQMMAQLGLLSSGWAQAKMQRQRGLMWGSIAILYGAG
jgi:hypothetical protein